MLRKRQGAAEGSVAAYGDHSVQTQELAGVCGLLLTGLRHELLAAGSIEDGAAAIDDVADAGVIHHKDIAVDQSIPAPTDSDTIDPAIACSSNNSTDCRVHSGSVAATGQNTDAFHSVGHLDLSFNCNYWISNSMVVRSALLM